MLTKHSCAGCVRPGRAGRPARARPGRRPPQTQRRARRSSRRGCPEQEGRGAPAARPPQPLRRRYRRARPGPVPAPLSPGAASLPGPEGPVAQLPHPRDAAVSASRPPPARGTDQREGGAGGLDPALADGAHRGAHHGGGHGPAPSATGSPGRTRRDATAHRPGRGGSTPGSGSGSGSGPLRAGGPRAARTDKRRGGRGALPFSCAAGGRPRQNSRPGVTWAGEVLLKRFND